MTITFKQLYRGDTSDSQAFAVDEVRVWVFKLRFQQASPSLPSFAKRSPRIRAAGNRRGGGIRVQKDLLQEAKSTLEVESCTSNKGSAAAAG